MPKNQAWTTLALLLALLLAPLLASPALAVGVGQLDDFQDGTTQDWVAGLAGGNPPVPPANAPDAGPAGIGDNALRLTATGGAGAGSRLAVNNITADWTGDYAELGDEIVSLLIDANNTSAQPLTLRVAIISNFGGAFVSEGKPLAAFSGWTTLLFKIGRDDLLATPSGIDVDVALASVDNLRILHATGVTFQGDVVVATLDLDNIEAIPEPGSTLLLGSGVALVWGLGLRRRSRG